MIDRTFTQQAGAQSTGCRTMAWALPKGDVVRQSVGPNIATTGTWNAEAICIGPVSFVRSMAHRFTAAINSRIVVAPDKTRIGM